MLVNNVGHYLPGDGDFLDQHAGRVGARCTASTSSTSSSARARSCPGWWSSGRGSVDQRVERRGVPGDPAPAVYSAFKGAITQFTKSLAVELGNDGVRVNAIAPDLTETLQVPYSAWVPDEQRSCIPTWVPVGRFGTADDIAGRRAVPRLGPLGVRHRHHRPRRRRQPRGRRLVPPPRRHLDQPPPRPLTPSVGAILGRMDHVLHQRV